MQGPKLGCGEGGCGACAVLVERKDPVTGACYSSGSGTGRNPSRWLRLKCAPCLHRKHVSLDYQLLFGSSRRPAWRHHHDQRRSGQLQVRLQPRARYVMSTHGTSSKRFNRQSDFKVDFFLVPSWSSLSYCDFKLPVLDYPGAAVAAGLMGLSGDTASLQHYHTS